jgi:hypothetical protein
MMSRHIWNSLPASFCADSGYGTPRPGVTRLEAFNPVQGHRARTLLSGPLQIAEMSSTVRCAVMANRLSRAWSWRSV